MVNKNAIIFGETQFAITCINNLLEKNWKIIGVVTRDHNVINWCKIHNISIMNNDEVFQVDHKSCYLFSIINPYIISNKLLNYIEPIKAINYHDSLLPLYAGLNSTTWSILNNEKLHGITWHEINEGIDEGQIFYQTTIDIDKNDSAFELNLKCTEAGLIGFTKVINDIENGELCGYNQDLTVKTYFGKDHIPLNYAYLTSLEDHNYINKLFNSLSFGKGYVNPVATCKIRCKGKNYILEKKDSYSYLNLINLSTCTIRDIYGKIINADIDLTDIENYYLNIDEISYLKNLKSLEFNTYNKITNLINPVEPESGLFELLSNTPSRIDIQLKIDISINDLCFFLSIILNRLGSTNTFIKIYHKNNQISHILEEITEQIGILAIKNCILDYSFEEMQEYVNYNILNNKFLTVKDFSYRYNINLKSEFAVSEYESTDLEDHRVLFFINKDILTIKFLQQDYNLIDVISRSLRVLIDNHANSNCTYLKINEIFLLSQDDYYKTIYEWNKTEAYYPERKTIHQLFEEQVLRTPDSIAVVYEDIKLTYEELNTIANQLAHYLINSYGLQADDLIALCLDKSEQMIIIILAVLKTGAAYVPISPDYPDERIAYILNDTKTKVLLVNEIHANKLSNILAHNSIPVNIEQIDNIDLQNKLAIHPKTNPNQSITSNSLAYVIYTSGTTGNPKGVMIEHRSVVNMISMLTQKLFKNHTVWAKSNIFNCMFYANYVFDVHVAELFTTISYGNTLYIPNDEIRHDIVLLSEYIFKNNIHIATIPPAMLIKNDVLPLKILIVAGDITDKSIMMDYVTNKVQIINAYGPTEATVYTSLHEYILGISTNIGKPISNIKTYVLGNNLNPLPIGAIGELYIGGECLARGYLNLPELTQEKFIANPFQNEAGKNNTKGTRLYKTGDLVRYLPNGDIEYIGRNDFQVKIRGYRIEIGEIETRLANYPGIKHAVVLVKEHQLDNGSGNKYLVGYYVAEHQLDQDKILAYLKDHLNEYMIPHILVHLEKLPLTINGKIDRKSLPTPEFKLSSYVAPRNKIESMMCEIWQEVIGVNKIGIIDDFFALGGDSITSMQLIYALKQNGYNLKIKDLHTERTIKNICQLKSFNNSETISVSQQNLPAYNFDLLPIQKWFFEQQFSKQNHWNQSFLIKVPLLDLNKLNTVLELLVQHHDVLRLNYTKKDKDYYQYYSDKFIIPVVKSLDVSKVTKEYLDKTLTKWQSDFDIFSGYLWQVGYLYGYTDDSARLYFSFHHLLIDSVSWRIIADDLKKLFENESLGDKTSSYYKWEQAVKNYSKSNSHEYLYWESVIKNKLNYSKFIDNNSSNYSMSEIKLNKSETETFIILANQIFNCQINDLLLTALAYTLQKWSKSETNLITLEGHGRENIDETVDVSHTIGWFTTAFPVKLVTCSSLIETIYHTIANLRSIPNKGIGYGAIKYCNKNVENLLNGSELPPISFNYLGQFKSYGDFWQIIDENSGVNINSNNKDNNLINILGMVFDNQIKFTFRSYLGVGQTKELANNFKESLLNIIKKVSELNSASVSNPSSLSSSMIFPSQARYLATENIYYNFYNAWMCIKIESLDIAKLKNAYFHMKQNHDILNATFIKTSTNSWKIKFNDYKYDDTDFEIIKLDNAVHNNVEVKNIIDRLHNKIDIECGKTIRSGIIQFKDTSIFFILINHLVMDKHSLNIILNEISLFYNTKNYVNKSMIQYKNILSVTGNYLKNKDIAAVTYYWKNLYESKDTLPVENIAPFKTSDLQSTADILIFTKEEYQNLNSILNNYSESLFYSMLLSGIYQALCKTFSINDFIINTVHNGRISDFYNIEISNVVGWIASTIPIRLNMINMNKTEIDNIIKIKQYTNSIPWNGLSHDILKYLIKDKNVLNKFRKINVEFNYRGVTTSLPNNSIFKFDNIIDSGLNTHMDSVPEYPLYLAGYQNHNGVYIAITFSAKSYSCETINNMSTEISNVFKNIKNFLLKI